MVREAGQICGSLLAGFYRKGLADFSKFYFPSIIFLKGRKTVFLREERRCNEFSMIDFTLLSSSLSSRGWQPSSACFSLAKPSR
jgi:hypothetical protein